MPVVRDHTALLSGTSVHGASGKGAFYTYAFSAAVPAYYRGRFSEESLATFRPLTAAEQDAARAALQAWASVSGIVLFEVAGEGDIQFGVYASGLVPEGSVAAAFYPAGSTDLAIASDIFLTPPAAGDPYILRHEIGHALGLKHPHQGEVTLASDLDHLDSTVMSYNDGGGIYSGHELGPLDRDAIQSLYGTDAADGTQVASWSWNPATRTLTQTGFEAGDVLLGVATVDVISGRGGSDALHGRGGNDRLDGGAGADSLHGGRGDDALAGGTEGDGLDGGEGRDTLNGAAGADTLKGGAGDDLYVVDQAGDRVIEASAADGADTVQSAISYALGAHVEHLVLTGSAAISGTGNGLANVLTGNGAGNALSGGAGADTMRGGAGNDRYVVDQGGDRAVESSAGGLDTVIGPVSFTLGAHVENLTLTGTAAVAGTGNELANILIGNGAANQLSGLAGDDDLDGGGGGDTMRGGAGNDLYAIDHGGDRVIETSASHGSDSVRSAVSHTLGDHVENLTLAGTAPLNGTGNALANRLTGNGGINKLSGGDGGDRLSGSGSADTLSGGGGDDKLYGGTGHDSLTGGAGRNGFYFHTPLDARANVDTIADFSPAHDTIFLDRHVFTRIADGALAASAFRGGAAARDADDRILYEAASGRIFYDSDGSGAGTAILFAQVAAGTALTHADFAAFI